MGILALVLIGTPVVLVLAVVLGVRLVRWARKNRARAAAMMTGSYLDDVAGGAVDDDDDGTMSRFFDWVGHQVDALSGTDKPASDADGDAPAVTDPGHHGNAHHDAGCSDGSSSD